MFCIIKRWLALLPFICLNGAVLIVASWQAIKISLGYYPIIDLTTVTTEYYCRLFKDIFFQKALGYSFYIAFVATFLSILIGLFLSILIIKLPNTQRLLQICRIPITLPYLIVIMMMLQLISQTGLFSRILINVGIIQSASDFPLLIHDQGGIGILSVMLYKQIPYVLVTCGVLLNSISSHYELVAANLGANRWQIIKYIWLPLIQSTLFTLFVVLFSFNFGSFEVPYMLGNPANETIAVRAYQVFNQADLTNRPQSMAMSVVMSLICGTVAFLALGISHKLSGGRKGAMGIE